MSRLLDGIDDVLLATSAPVTAAPLTMACWCLSSSSAAGQQLITLDNGAATHRFSLTLLGTVAGDPLGAVAVAGGTAARADTTAGYSAGVWQHACGVFTSATSRAAFINGGSKGTNTTSRAPTGVANTRIGLLADASGPMVGRIAEVGIWNVALTDAEVAVLARGVSPLLVRRANLVFYAPLWGTSSPERDYTAGQRHLTVTGATAEAHAPVQPLGMGTLWVPASVTTESHSGSAVLTGGGAVVATGQKDVAAAVTISGGGVPVATGQKDTAGTAALTGGGALVGQGAKAATVTSAVTGGGTVGGSGEAGFQGTAAISGGGTPTATWTTDRAGTTALSGGGAVTATGEGARSGTAAVSGGGQVLATGEAARFGTAAISGGGTITATGTAAEEHSGTATLTGGGALTATGQADRAGTAALSGGDTSTAQGQKNAQVSTGITGGGQVTGTGTADETHSGTASVTGGGAIVVSGEAGRQVALTVSVGGQLLVTGTAGRLETATVTGSGHLVVTGQKDTTGTVLVTGAGTIIVTGARDHVVYGDSTTGELTLSGTGAVASPTAGRLSRRGAPHIEQPKTGSIC